MQAGVPQGHNLSLWLEQVNIVNDVDQVKELNQVN